MGSMVFHQDQQKSLRGSCYNQNLPIWLYHSSINVPYQQPPLLPLPQIPNTKPAPPTTQPKVPMTRPRSQSLFTPKKSKPPSLDRSSQLENKRVGRRVSDKHIMRSVSESASCRGTNMDDYSGFIFSVSPHPSSLPLPKFPLPARAKTGGTCKANAGVDDSVTTDGLRRLLRLR